jgi:predicted DNA-binding protein
MGKFFRTQLRLPTDFIKRLDKLQDRSGVDRSNHIRIAISRYLEEEEMRTLALKKIITEEATRASGIQRKN